MTSQLYEMNSSSICLTLFCFFVSLVNFSYWSKFHVNIITGSGLVTIYSRFIDCGLKSFETIDEKKINNLLKV